MQPVTSELICRYLEKHPPSPARNIARALNLTITDVRYHLQKLTAQGRIQAQSVEVSSRPGRPAVLYRMTPTCTPAAIHLLTGTLLNLVSRVEGEAFIRQLAGNLIPPEILALTSPVVRISRFIQYLNTLGYEARWESRPLLPRVEFRLCPYAAIKETHPQCCEIDRSMLMLAAGCRVTRVEQPVCLFQLHTEEPVD